MTHPSVRPRGSQEQTMHVHWEQDVNGREKRVNKHKPSSISQFRFKWSWPSHLPANHWPPSAKYTSNPAWPDQYQPMLMTESGVGATPLPSRKRSGKKSISWARKADFSKLFNSIPVPHFKPSPSSPSSELIPKSAAQTLPFDCLYLIFQALDDLEHDDPYRLLRSSDPVRAYLYEPFELEDSTPSRWALMSCSLVCKAWCFPAQLRLLRFTKLHTSSQAAGLINYLANLADDHPKLAQASSSSRAPSGAATASAGGPWPKYRAIANHVQQLELGVDAPPHAGCCYAPASEHHDWTPPRRKESGQNLTRWQTFDVLRRCHRIQQLTLHHWRPDDLTAPMDSKSPYLPPISFDVLRRHAPFERLTTLRLFRYSGTWRSLCDLLVLTTELTSLSFEGAITDGQALMRKVNDTRPKPQRSSPVEYDLELFSTTLRLPPVPFSLERLSVGGYQSSFLIGFSWLLSKSYHTLNRLDIGRCPASFTPSIEELLAGLEKASKDGVNRITHLSATLSPGVDTPRLIRACPKLRAIRMDGTPCTTAIALNRAQQAAQQDAPQEAAGGGPGPAPGIQLNAGPALGVAILAAQQQAAANVAAAANAAAAPTATSPQQQSRNLSTATGPAPPPPVPATLRALHLYACLNALPAPLFALNLCYLSSPHSSNSPPRPSHRRIASSTTMRQTSVGSRMSLHLPSLSTSTNTTSNRASTAPTLLSISPSSFPPSSFYDHPSFPSEMGVIATSPQTTLPPSASSSYSRFDPIVHSSFTHTHPANPLPSPSSMSSSNHPPGRSPSPRELALLAHLLNHSKRLSRLWSLNMEFAPRMAFPDAPLAELRMLREVCARRGVGLEMPDLYDLVMGTSGYGGMSGGLSPPA
ncbi:hypothetical protein DL93DRAFT_2171894 [Clavulina sp. PMI_390]|nr:hypothetical protein DL93DRAFT_2171894 [Clavulina sp. PMI_390]